MPTSPHRIAVVALPGVIPFELGIPSRIFGMARDSHGNRLYDVVTCTREPGTLATSADYDIVVDAGLDTLSTADTVILPASYDIDLTLAEHGLPPDLHRALTRLHPGTRIASICTAAFILAAAGLLDGRPATTHWVHAPQLRRQHPNIDVDADVLFIDDGDILTSAGVAAGIDLCLHMVRRDFGSGVANAVARRSVVPPWRDGGQAQYIEQPVPDASATSTAPARAWALANLDQHISIPALARRTRMSLRTFTRRFRDEVGTPPGQWLLRQRVEAARILLETSDLSTDHIATRAGLGTSASLRRHFHAQVGVAPATYRKTFHTRATATD